MEEQSSPAAQTLDSVKNAKRMTRHASDIAVIGCFATQEDKSAEAVMGAAEQLREEYKNIAITTKADIMQALGCKPGTMRVYVPLKWMSKHDPEFHEMKLVPPSNKYSINCRTVKPKRTLSLLSRNTACRLLDSARRTP